MKKFLMLVSLILVAVIVVPSYAARPTPEPGPVCAIQGINRAESTVNSPVINTTYQLATLAGPGTFVTARVAALGGTFPPESLRLQLTIDGKVIVNHTFLDQALLTGASGAEAAVAFGIFGTDHSMIVGFQLPVVFNSSLVLSVTTGEQGPLPVITGTVIYGE